jgi:hypothetical protein
MVGDDAEVILSRKDPVRNEPSNLVKKVNIQALIAYEDLGGEVSVVEIREPIDIGLIRVPKVFHALGLSDDIMPPRDEFFAKRVWHDLSKHNKAVEAGIHWEFLCDVDGAR